MPLPLGEPLERMVCSAAAAPPDALSASPMCVCVYVYAYVYVYVCI